MEIEGCLLIAVFGKIVDVQGDTRDHSELAVGIGGEFVPIGDLTRKFISSECPTFAAKPKIWLFLDAKTSTDNYNDQMASCTT